MTSQHDKPKRWRPRFSVRTLAIVVTLVCCYFSLWKLTNTKGVRDVMNYCSEHGLQIQDDNISTPVPLIIRAPESMGGPLTFGSLMLKRYYYFWFFGYVAKLPFEREI